MPNDQPLPGWPRALNLRLAAAYLSLSPTLFLERVKAKDIPDAIQLTPGRRAWLRERLDAWLDQRAGETGGSAPQANPWDDT